MYLILQLKSIYKQITENMYLLFKYFYLKYYPSLLNLIHSSTDLSCATYEL